jgi:hypothetical protein
MISGELLKEIILSNREFILNQVSGIVKRESIHFPKDSNRVCVLYGVRRSGKTFILYDLFRANSGKTLYIDFEDERLGNFKVEDFELLKEVFLELNPGLINQKKIFLFDEVQNISGWERFCRRVSERENTGVFVSGSSSRGMPLEIHTSLRGRSWSVEVTPFSFREYLAVKGVEAKNLIYTQGKITVKKHFKDFMRWGSFPEIILSQTQFEKNKILKEYLSSIFFRDLVERFKINNIHLLDVLVDELFSSFSRKFSLSFFYRKYKEKFPFSKDSLFAYYKDLLQSMLVLEVRKYAESAYKRMRNPAKIYLIDTGLAKRVIAENAGWLLENIVFLELRKKYDDIYYFEEINECDFIALKEGKLSAFQVCYDLNEGNREREINGIISCCKNAKISRGHILTFDQEEILKNEGIEINIMPVWKWLLSGDS